MRSKYCLFILFISSFFSEEILSIPAFARKYNMTCKTCHSPFPKLKPYGDEFAANGFVLKDKDAPRYYVETGDNDLSLIRDLPLAIRMEGYLTYNNNKSENSDFSTPYIIKLLSGGSIANNISYYFYFFFTERGEVAGLEDAFLMFNNLFSTDLDFYVGQFQISDPLFKRELRLTFADYLIYDATVGYSNINLTYDRGVMFTYGFDSGTDLTLEVLNGNGLTAANSFKVFDNDKYKNLFGRVSQDITSNVRIGGFGYWGKEEQENRHAPEKETNEIWMLGPDLTVDIDPLQLNVQYVERRDKNPFFLLNSPEQIKTRGAFGELVFRPDGDNSKWYAVGLYNWVESGQDDLDIKTGTAHLGYLLRRNFRITGEFTYDFTNKFGQASIGLITAF
ncbi:MAG: hypothetical protein WCE54_03940 [Ignavibacteriaceae bacterium]